MGGSLKNTTAIFRRKRDSTERLERTHTDLRTPSSSPSMHKGGDVNGLAKAK